MFFLPYLLSVRMTLSNCKVLAHLNALNIYVYSDLRKYISGVLLNSRMLICTFVFTCVKIAFLVMLP